MLVIGAASGYILRSTTNGMTMGDRVALVTGASRGIGRAIATRLAKDGMRVVGTSRDPSRVAAAPGVRMAALDVTSDASVRSCVDGVLAREGRIDLLVNNAGFLLLGAVEELTVDEARRQFETNLFGVLRTTQAVLPHMRERRSGRVINIGSLSADFAIPFGGLYTATKRALQGLTEALRHEVRPFGVDVCLVEATFIATEAGEIAVMPAHPYAEYERARLLANAAWRRQIADGPGVSVVANRVAALARARKTRFRYPAGFNALWMPLLRPLVPSWLVERLVARRFDLHRVSPPDSSGPAVSPQRERIS